MKYRTSPLILLFCFALLSGCGGGGGSSSSPAPPTTAVAFNIDWGARSRSVSGHSATGRDVNGLTSALSAVVTLKAANPDGTDFIWTLDRDTNLAAHTQSFKSTSFAKIGSWNLTVNLYAQADGAGSVVGTAAGQVTLKSDGTGIDTVTTSGVIKTLTILAGQNVPVGQTVDLSISPQDASGNLVAVTPGSATWQVVSGGSFLSFTNGSAQGLAAGTATVQASIDGITSPQATVTVGAAAGMLTISVTDNFGSLIPGVLVSCTENGTLAKQYTSTTGSDTISLLPGPVTISATHDGFQPGQGTAQVQSGQTASVTVVLLPVGAATAATIASSEISLKSNTLNFEIDIAVLDLNGNPITNLPSSAFSITKFSTSGETYTPTLVSANPVTTPYQGPVSAFIAVDQSDSITAADPNNSRLQAAKSFFSKLANGDDATFGYFPEANLSPDMQTYPSIGFVTDGSTYYPEIAALAKKGYTGTPIYHAIVEGTDLTAQLGNNAIKVIVVITDGISSHDAATIDQAVNEAVTKGVKIYTVGLGKSVKTNILAELAAKTGGATMSANTATQLVSYYSSLGALLEGAGSFYQTRWIATKSPDAFQSGDVLSSNVTISLPGGSITTPFYLTVQ